MNIKQNLFIGLEALQVVLARKDTKCLNLCHKVSLTNRCNVDARSAVEDTYSTATHERGELRKLVQQVKDLLDDPIIDVSSDALYR